MLVGEQILDRRVDRLEAGPLDVWDQAFEETRFPRAPRSGGCEYPQARRR